MKKMTESDAITKDLFLAFSIDVKKLLEKLEEGKKAKLRNRKKNLSKSAVVDCLSSSTAHGLPQLVQPVTICYRGNSPLSIQDILVNCRFGKQEEDCSPMDFPMKNCVRLNFGGNQSLLVQDTESFRSGLISVYFK